MRRRILPANPDLEYYKKTAKTLLRAWRARKAVTVSLDGETVDVTPEHLAEWAGQLRGEPRLSDVHFLIAREYGFRNWSAFAAAVAGSRREPAEESRFLEPRDPTVSALVAAIREGDVARLEALLAAEPELARILIRDGSKARSLLHIATDWPGHFPNVAETIAAIVAAGAETDTRFVGGPHRETALHWAASSGDLAALEALLDAGADIEADGAVIAGGTALADAVAFAQWEAANRLVEVGAATNLDHEAALGLTERVTERFAAANPPAGTDLHRALWFACHGGQATTAEFLLARGADPEWRPPWENLSASQAALRNGFAELARRVAVADIK